MPDGAAHPWPRHMRAKTAAAYLDVSESHFFAAIAPGLPKHNITPGIVGWLREDLDAWLDARTGRAAASHERNPWHR